MATYRGHVSKKLSLIAFPFNATISVGMKLVSKGKEVGAISSTVKSETFDKTLALACIKHGYFEPGTDVEAKMELGSVLGEIVKPILNK